MKDYGNIAKEYFQEGYNCAQAVFLALTDAHSLEKQQAARLTNCFGGGLAQTGGLCGAVAGACMAVSAKHGRDEPSRTEEAMAQQKKNYQLVQELLAHFQKEFGARDCPALLKKGLAASGEQKNPKCLCPAYVQRAAELAGEALEK